MGLGDYLNKLGFFRELIYSSIFAGLITILGCDGCDSGPVSPSNGGNGPDTTVCIGDKGVTKEDGVLILEVKDQRFNVNVVDSFDSPLEDVLVGGHELGDNHYLFLAEDSLGRFAPHAVYENPNQNSSIDGLDDGLNPFDVDIILIPIYEDSSYVRRFKTIPADLPMDKFIPVATTNLTNLGKVYAEERSLFTNTEILEFITEIPGSPGIISFATELNDFRNTFLEEEGYAVRWSYVLNDIARQFGGGFNPDAYYLNVLLHEGSGVLINRTNWEGYCTLKSNVFDENGIPVNNAFIELLGINGGSGYTDLEGRCMLLFLKERLYPIIVSASGFETLNLEDYIYQPLHPNYVCNIIDFILKEPVIRDTLVLHPGPEEGKDAYISDRYPNTNYGGDRDLYMRYHFGGDPDINRSYLYLDISSIPDNAIIRSATLSGWSRGTSGEGDLTLAIKKVLDDWGEDQIDWTNQPRFDSFIYDTVVPVQGPYHEEISFSFPGLVQEWVEEDNNKGIAIVFNEESGKKIVTFHSSDYPYFNFRWEAKIIYEH